MAAFPFVGHRISSSTVILTSRSPQPNLPLLFFILILTVLNFGLVLGSQLPDGSSPYFPERGYAGIYQRALDLENPGVVLSVSLQPGDEDLPTLALLRLGRGAKVVSVYATTGEATPSDFSGEAPFMLAARRKEESYRVSSYLGCESYYLNLRDPGVVSQRSELERMWNKDTVVSRLLRTIESYRPDVILLQRDLGGDTVKVSFLRDMVLEAVRLARGVTEGRDGQKGQGMKGWSVRRVLADLGSQPGAIRENVGGRHPVWKKTYFSIAQEAARHYESLKTLIQAKSSWSDRAYSFLGQSARQAPRTVEGRIQFTSPRLQKLASWMRSVARTARGKDRTLALATVSSAIDSVDRALATDIPKRSSADRRVLLDWKSTLEDLRCSLLDVDIPLEVSDSLVSRLQLFFVTFKALPSRLKPENTQVLFPGAMNRDWVVNESLESTFPLESSKEFRILTPRSIQFNTPASVFGLDKPYARTNFSFVVIHKDSIRQRNFQYRKTIPLRIVPRFSTEVYTPVVFATSGELVIYRLQNYTRDGVYGETFVDDSLVTSDHRQFRLSTKDSWVLDTLRLSWKGPIPAGDHVHDLKISGEKVGGFVARSFDVVADTVQEIGVISGLHSSSVTEAMRRLNLRYVTLDSASVLTSDMAQFSTLIIDRDALRLRPDVEGLSARLEEWIRNGGRLIVLPQFNSPPFGVVERAGLGFHSAPPLEPKSALDVDSSSAIVRLPNRIDAGDWEGWIFARAWGSVEVKGDQSTAVVIRHADSGVPLLVTKRDGKGAITVVALDLSSQLLNIHPGAYRLFANLVGYSDHVR
jgi:hypothetical protein